MPWLLFQVCRSFVWLLLFNLHSGSGEVARISPSSGSLCGGSRLSVYGTGFAPNVSENRVIIGDGECAIESVSEDKLICQVPYRDQKVSTGKESASEQVSVYARGKLISPPSLQFRFDAKAVPGLIVDWGPNTGQANDVLSFQGKDKLSGASVTLGGAGCKVQLSEQTKDGTYLQCVPPPREAGVAAVEVSFGPERGFACPAPSSPPLKYTYTLALQSALPTQLEAEAYTPFDGGRRSWGHNPVGSDEGTITIVGQGLGPSTIFRLCGADSFCEHEGPVENDPAMYHAGDWSFQTVKCRPGPLDPAKAPGGKRTCDLTAEGADGMFSATLQDVWTYGPPKAPAAPAPGPAAGAPVYAVASLPPLHYPLPADPVDPIDMPSYAPGPAAYAYSPAAPAAGVAGTGLSVPAPAPAPYAPPVLPPPTVPVPAEMTEAKMKRVLKKQAQNVLSNVFDNLANALKSRVGAAELYKPVDELPPPYPQGAVEGASAPEPMSAVEANAVEATTTLEPPPPLPAAAPESTEPPPPAPQGLMPEGAAPAPAAASDAVFLQGLEAQMNDIRAQDDAILTASSFDSQQLRDIQGVANSNVFTPVGGTPTLRGGQQHLMVSGSGIRL